MKAITSYLGGNHTAAQFIRFLITGVFNTLFGYLVFALLIWMHAPVVGALVAANVAGVMLNFQTIGRIVFRRAKWRLIFRFTGVYVGIFLLNWVALSYLMRLGTDVVVAQGLLTPILAVCSFLANKFLVFEPRRA